MARREMPLEHAPGELELLAHAVAVGVMAHIRAEAHHRRVEPASLEAVDQLLPAVHLAHRVIKVTALSRMWREAEPSSTASQ